jgi:hypothetical protein
MNKCEHGVYDPYGDQKYCTVCNPVKLNSNEFNFKTIETTVGRLSIARHKELFKQA